MNHVQTNGSISTKYEMYSSMLYKLCYLSLCNKNDAEDAVQDTFIKYMKTSPVFTSDEHEKAWFIRVATNVCHDKHRFRLRQKAIPLEDAESRAMITEESDVLREILLLPAKCKTPLYLHYYEGYSIQEIARMLESKESTVKSLLFRGRQKLRLNL